MPTNKKKKKQDSTAHVSASPVFRRESYEVWRSRLTGGLVILTRRQHRMGSWCLYQLISTSGALQAPEEFRVPRSTFEGQYEYAGHRAARVPGAGPRPASYRFIT